MKFLVKSIRENEKVSIEKINKKRDTKFIGIENDGYKNLKEIKSNKKLDLISIEGGVEKYEDISTFSTTLSSALLFLNPSNNSIFEATLRRDFDLFAVVEKKLKNETEEQNIQKLIEPEKNQFNQFSFPHQHQQQQQQQQHNEFNGRTYTDIRQNVQQYLGPNVQQTYQYGEQIATGENNFLNSKQEEPQQFYQNTEQSLSLLQNHLQYPPAFSTNFVPSIPVQVPVPIPAVPPPPPPLPLPPLPSDVSTSSNRIEEERMVGNEMIRHNRDEVLNLTEKEGINIGNNNNNNNDINNNKNNINDNNNNNNNNNNINNNKNNINDNNNNINDNNINK